NYGKEDKAARSYNLVALNIGD
ncbi:hypothetical protein Tco_1309225, partial [Tanacetum coccineum]